MLIPIVISPYCKWGPMYNIFWSGTMLEQHHKFPTKCPAAEQIYYSATMTHPLLVRVVNMATANWKWEKS